MEAECKCCCLRHCTGGYAVAAPSQADEKAGKVQLVHQEIDVASTADALLQARKVVIVPGKDTCTH